MTRIVPESRPVSVPTFQINGADMYALNLYVEHLGRDTFGDLDPTEALEGLSSCLLAKDPDNDNDFVFKPEPFGLHRQIIAAGYVGNETGQPDPVLTFLGAMVTRRFIVEQVHDQTWWDKVRRRNRIFRSFVFGDPPSMPRKME